MRTVWLCLTNRFLLTRECQMIISSIIYSKKLLDINKRYGLDSPERVKAESTYGLESVGVVEDYTRRKYRREYERNRALESLAYIGILGLLFCGL